MTMPDGLDNSTNLAPSFEAEWAKLTKAELIHKMHDVWVERAELLREKSEGRRTHRIKVAEDAYADLVSGRKAFEIRKNDRLYQVGDWLVMTEIARDDPRSFARAGGIRATATITYVHSGYGMDRTDEWGFVVLGLEDVKEERS